MSAILRFHLWPIAAAMLCVAAAAVSPPTAHAQTVSLSDAPMEVQIWPGGEQGYTLFIVTGHLPEGTQLPAVVRLPLPQGAEVVWSGEILGGPVEADPVRQYSVVEGIGGPAIEMTAEETLTVQYEAIGAPLSVSNGLITSEFNWVQSVEAGEIAFAVRIPPSAVVVRIVPESPGPPVTNESGERLYALTPVVLPEGTPYSITIGYGPEGAGEGSGPPLLVWLGLLLAVAVFVLVLVAVRERGRAAASGSTDLS